MGSKTYRQGQEAQLARDLKRYAREMMVFFHREMHQEAGRFARDTTPVDTGEMRNRWGDRINGRDSIPAGVAANLSRIKLGTKSARINDDPGAAAIDFGRKRNHYKGFSRMGGSPQAPNGISEPARRHLLGYSETAAAAAIAAAERRFGR